MWSWKVELPGFSQDHIQSTRRGSLNVAGTYSSTDQTGEIRWQNAHAGQNYLKPQLEPKSVFLKLLDPFL